MDLYVNEPLFKKKKKEKRKETLLKNSKPNLSYKSRNTPILFLVLVGQQSIHTLHKKLDHEIYSYSPMS